jgi:excisionase family DNA binding protein
LEILNDRQLQVLLGIGEGALRAWRRKRGLPFVKINGRSHRYLKSEVMAWLKARSTNSTAAAS